MGPTNLGGRRKLQVGFIERAKVPAVLETLPSIGCVGIGSAHCIGRWVWVPGQWTPKGLWAVLAVGVSGKTTAAVAGGFILVSAGGAAVII
jgi:hypothetical protein